MKNFYTISDTYLIAQSDNALISPFWILRDKKPQTKLEKLFYNAHKVFRVRTRDLGNLNMPLTLHDADAMRVSLETLIAAKKQIHRERGE